MPPNKTGYCVACGQESELFFMLVDGVDKPHCFLCGMLIEDKPAAQSAQSAPQQRVKTLDLIMLADDSALARELIADKLTEQQIAKKVVALANGEEFLESFTRKYFENTPPNLVILDIRMPGINGVNAALSARCIEKGFAAKKPVPLLFFSSVVCDDTLKTAMMKVAPARYINKGASGNPDDLAGRIVGVIEKLLAT